MSTWYVLEGSGGYAGRTWEVFNSALRNPREAIVGLQDADLYPSLESAKADLRRLTEIHGAEFRPAAVAFDGRGKDAKISLARKTVDLRATEAKR